MATKKRGEVVAKTGAVLYLRVSTQRQAESGLGIEAQRAACLAYAAQRGLAVVSEHVDNGLSGRNEVADRPGLQAAVAAVKASAGNVLVVYSLSRLARSQRIIWSLVDDRGEHRLPVASATESFDTTTATGKAMVGMLGIWSQLEADLCSERTVAALEVARERGTQLGRPSMVESIDPKTRERYVDPRKVAIVRKVQGMRAQGMKLRDIVKKLNAEKVPTVTGRGEWWLKMVQRAVEIGLPPVVTT